MTPRHPARAAFGAALVLLAAIAAFGNQWFTDHVVLDARSNRARTILRIPSFFQWRFTRLGGETTIWVAQLLGAIAVVVLGYFMVWAVAKRASGLSLVLGAWGVTVLVAMAAGWLETVIAYGDLFPGISDPEGLGRFWYSVFNGAQPAAMFGAAVGLIAGLAAVLFAGSSDDGRAPTYHGVYVGAAPASAPVGVYVPVAASVPNDGDDPTTQYQTAAADPTGQYPYTSENEVTPPPPPHDPDRTTVIPSSAEWTSPPPPPPPPWAGPEERTSRD